MRLPLVCTLALLASKGWALYVRQEKTFEGPFRILDTEPLLGGEVQLPREVVQEWLGSTAEDGKPVEEVLRKPSRGRRMCIRLEKFLIGSEEAICATVCISIDNSIPKSAMLGFMHDDDKSIIRLPPRLAERKTLWAPEVKRELSAIPILLREFPLVTLFIVEPSTAAERLLVEGKGAGSLSAIAEVASAALFLRPEECTTFDGEGCGTPVRTRRNQGHTVTVMQIIDKVAAESREKLMHSMKVASLPALADYVESMQAENEEHSIEDLSERISAIHFDHEPMDAAWRYVHFKIFRSFPHLHLVPDLASCAVLTIEEVRTKVNLGFTWNLFLDEIFCATLTTEDLHVIISRNIDFGLLPMEAIFEGTVHLQTCDTLPAFAEFAPRYLYRDSLPVPSFELIESVLYQLKAHRCDPSTFFERMWRNVSKHRLRLEEYYKVSLVGSFKHYFRAIYKHFPELLNPAYIDTEQSACENETTRNIVKHIDLFPLTLGHSRPSPVEESLILQKYMTILSPAYGGSTSAQVAAASNVLQAVDFFFDIIDCGATPAPLHSGGGGGGETLRSLTWPSSPTAKAPPSTSSTLGVIIGTAALVLSYNAALSQEAPTQHINDESLLAIMGVVRHASLPTVMFYMKYVAEQSASPSEMHLLSDLASRGALTPIRDYAVLAMLCKELSEASFMGIFATMPLHPEQEALFCAILNMTAALWPYKEQAPLVTIYDEKIKQYRTAPLTRLYELLEVVVDLGHADTVTLARVFLYLRYDMPFSETHINGRTGFHSGRLEDSPEIHFERDFCWIVNGLLGAKYVLRPDEPAEYATEYNVDIVEHSLNFEAVGFRLSRDGEAYGLPRPLAKRK